MALGVLFFVVISFLVIFKTKKAEGTVNEIGDYVYSSEIKIKTGSGDGEYDDIKGYSGFDWEEIKNIMNSNSLRLIQEYAKTTNNVSVLNNLNPNKKPEGQVWLWGGEGNFEINSKTSISGKGTIIIKGADLVINGDMDYETTKSSVGFIVLENESGVGGSIFIGGGVNSTVGAYYASKEIKFE